MKKLLIIFLVIATSCFAQIEGDGLDHGKLGLNKTDITIIPTGLIATAIDSTSIGLEWTDNSNNEFGFVIEQSLNGLLYNIIDTANVNDTTYINGDLTPDTKYWYRIYAYNKKFNSGYSNIACATTIGILPQAPSLLIANAIDSMSIDLAWTDNSDSETGFVIERGLNGIDFAEIDTNIANDTSYSDTGLESFTIYFYRIYAFNGNGRSDYSNIAHDTTDDVMPFAPTNLVATVVDSSQIDLTWTDNAQNETRYLIERGLDGIDFVEIDDIPPNSESYSDIGLNPNTEYFYRVRCITAKDTCNYSNIDSATTYNAIEQVAYDSGAGATLTAKIKDTYPVLFGMKRLWRDAGDSCVRLSRDSDSTQTTFGFMVSGYVDTNAINTWKNGSIVRGVRNIDQSGNGNTGVQNTFSSRPQFVNNSGFVYDGNDFMTTPVITALSNFTIMVKATTTTVTTGDGFLIERTIATNQLIDIFRTDDDLSFRYRDDGNVGLTLAKKINILSINTWYNIAGVRNTVLDRGLLYINGSEVDNVEDVSGTIITPTLKIGLHQNGLTGWVGSVNNLLLSKYAFTPTQVNSVYNYLK